MADRMAAEGRRSSVRERAASAFTSSIATTTGWCFDGVTCKSSFSERTTLTRKATTSAVVFESPICRVCMRRRAAGVPQKRHGLPSVRPIATHSWGRQMSTVLDPDGNLLRMIADDDSGGTFKR
jgi:hypothetical protein